MLARAAALLLIASNALAGIAYRFDGTAGTGNVIAEGQSFRIESISGGRVVSVMLSADGGKTLTTIDPAAKTFSVQRVGDLLDSLSVTNPKATARDLGDGGPIEGYPTRRWIVDSSYDVRVADTVVHVQTHSESWRTDRIHEEEPFKGTRFVTMLPGNVKGFPLKEVMTVKTGESSVTATTEVHGVHNVITTPAMFAVPPGYKRK